MPARSNPTARQERLGTELRRLREAAGLSARAAAAAIGTNPMQMSHMETGRSGVSEERLRRLAAHYACLDEALVNALVAMANERGKGWWEDYRGLLGHGVLDLAELEHHATCIRTFQYLYVPGLLQSEGYIRALFSSGVPKPPPRQMEYAIEFRLRRRDAIERDSAPDFTAVIHEAPLRTRVGDRKTSREQLDLLLELSERRNVTVRVIPFDVEGFASAGASMFYVGGPLPQLDTVHLEASYDTVWVDAEAQLRRYRAVLDTLERSALDVPESRDLIHRIRRDL